MDGGRGGRAARRQPARQRKRTRPSRGHPGLLRAGGHLGLDRALLVSAAGLRRRDRPARRLPPLAGDGHAVARLRAQGRGRPLLCGLAALPWHGRYARPRGAGARQRRVARVLCGQAAAGARHLHHRIRGDPPDSGGSGPPRVWRAPARQGRRPYDGVLADRRFGSPPGRRRPQSIRAADEPDNAFESHRFDGLRVARSAGQNVFERRTPPSGKNRRRKRLQRKNRCPRGAKGSRSKKLPPNSRCPKRRPQNRR